MPGRKDFDLTAIDYCGNKIPQDEIDFLSRSNQTEKWIYVLPHEKSLLRTYFIEPNLGKRGKVLKKYIGKNLHTSINGVMFDYIITQY